MTRWTSVRVTAKRRPITETEAGHDVTTVTVAADFDQDGLPDEWELANGLDPDSDGDGIFDGTELSVTSANPDTDLSRGAFQADADPSTRTDPLNRNTDGDALDDGLEDANHNGAIDPGETDPATPATFCSTDTDCGSDTVCQASICAPKPLDRPEVTGCGCASGGSSDFDALALAVLALGLAATIPRRRRGPC